jgi:hypothetical protein
LEDGPSKRANRPLAVPHVSSPVAAGSTPPAEGTGSTIYSAVAAKDSTLRITDFLEGLKDAEADWEGTLSSFIAFGFAAFTAELKKAMSKEKAARSVADRALAEEKAARQAAEQSLLSSNEANTLLAKGLDSTQASLTTTTDKLSSKSSALDHAVIQEQQMKIQLTVCEEKLMTCEEKLTVANEKLKAIEEKMKT